MRVFISSRLLELGPERKAAVDAVHFAGHTPLYIEAEPVVKDEEAKRVMDTLVANAEALLLIYYLSPGRQEPILNNLTPIQYEYSEFRRLHPNAPILLFQKTPDEFIAPYPQLINWFAQRAKEANLDIRRFSTPDELPTKVLEAASPLEHDNAAPKCEHRILIRYTGPDFIGMIGTMAELVFSRYQMNIDYISQAARSGHATVYVSCSPRGTAPELDELRRDVEGAIGQDLGTAEAQGRLVYGASATEPVHVSVDTDTAKPVSQQVYVEVRVIDVPGQLNAICKTLRRLWYNIDELQVRPAPVEYSRQLIMLLWLSYRGADRQLGLSGQVIQLEAHLSNLVGVRALGARILQSPGTS